MKFRNWFDRFYRTTFWGVVAAVVTIGVWEAKIFLFGSPTIGEPLLIVGGWEMTPFTPEVDAFLAFILPIFTTAAYRLMVPWKVGSYGDEDSSKKELDFEVFSGGLIGFLAAFLAVLALRVEANTIACVIAAVYFVLLFLCGLQDDKIFMLVSLLSGVTSFIALLGLFEGWAFPWTIPVVFLFRWLFVPWCKTRYQFDDLALVE